MRYLISVITRELIQISVETADRRSVFSIVNIITFSTHAHLTGMARRVPRVLAPGLALVKPTRRRLLLYCRSCVEPTSSHQLTVTSSQQEPESKDESGDGEDGAVRSVICH